MLFTILALIFYTTAIMLSTAASRAINSSLVTAIVNTISAVLPIAIVVPLISKHTLTNGRAGIFMAVLAGVCIALFSLAFNKSVQINKVALVSPILYGGTIFLTTILSYFIFKEKLPPIHVVGIITVGAGLLLIIYSVVTEK